MRFQTHALENSLMALRAFLNMRLVGAWILLFGTTFWLRPCYQQFLYTQHSTPVLAYTRVIIFAWIFLAVGIHWMQNMDKKRGIQNPFPYLLVFLVPVENVINTVYGFYWDFWFMLFCSMPLLELAFPLDIPVEFVPPCATECTESYDSPWQIDLQKSVEVSPESESDEHTVSALSATTAWIFKLIPLLWLPLCVLYLGFMLRWIAVSELNPAQSISIVLQVGFIQGVLTINICHELIHKVGSRVEVWSGYALSTLVFYSHWATIEHFTHHKLVGTILDGATARLNESVYHFVPRSVVQGLRSAWKKDPTKVLMGHFCSFVLSFVIYLVFGWLGLLAFLGQGVFAIIALEIVNYIEHYGLLLRTSERDIVTPLAAFNANAMISNFILLNLQRHSDHHHKSGKRYQRLEVEPEPTELPSGYNSMFLLALVPPLWFRVMNPKVEETFRKARQAGFLKKEV